MVVSSRHASRSSLLTATCSVEGPGLASKLEQSFAYEASFTSSSPSSLRACGTTAHRVGVTAAVLQQGSSCCAAWCHARASNQHVPLSVSPPTPVA